MMKFWKKPINIALSPNNTWKDTLVAFGELILPWNWLGWQKGKARLELVKRFEKWIGRPGEVWVMGSGRESLYLILKALDLNEGDEIILQSFTCMVVVNSIVWAGLKPVFVDADENFNLDKDKLKEKMTSRTKAVMIQHTFGIPAEVQAIKEFCKKNDLILIEDCAHAMGAEYQGKKVGTLGDLSFFSLGRSKVISCVSGGIIVCNNQKYSKKIENFYSQTSEMKKSLIFQNLCHPILSSLAKYTYNLGIGKAVMLAGQKLKLLSFEVTREEKKGILKQPFPTKLPNALAKLALVQFALLDKFNQKRIKTAEFYYENLKQLKSLQPANTDRQKGAIYLRYPLLCQHPTKILKAAKAEGIIVGDWYNTPIAPADIDQHKSHYQTGDNPNTEKLCKQVINLPTYQNLSLKDQKKIVNLIIKNAES